MSPVYDHRVERVAIHLMEAEGSARQNLPEGRHPRTVELPAWLRIQHWARLAHAQKHHLHWWYLHTRTAAICTCGLQHPLSPPPVLQVLGHRDPQTWKPTRLLVVHSSPSSASPQGADRPSPSLGRPAHQAACQTCHFRSPPLSPQDAVRARRTHAAARCAPPTADDEHALA
jgi:hypothetical protein